MDFGIKRLADLAPTGESQFLIEGLIHRTATMIYGRPKAGKSYLALSAAMALAEGSDWLGCPSQLSSVLLWALDPGQEEETRQRFDDAEGGTDSLLSITSVRPEDADEWWELFTEALLESGTDVLVVDNLSALLGRGSYNNDADVRPALGRLQGLLDVGIAVVLVHHSGKFNEETGSQKSPMGSTAIEAWARQFIRVESDGELRVSTVYGNNVPETTMAIAMDPNRRGEHGAFVTLLDVEETTPHDLAHDELVERARARWEARRARQKKQGRTPEQRERKADRNRQTDHAGAIRDFLKSGEWQKTGAITEGVTGHHTAIRGTLDNMVASKHLETKTEGRTVLYRLAA
nr:helicase RepA family protein [Streptomyces sp. NBC_00830]